MQLHKISSNIFIALISRTATSIIGLGIVGIMSRSLGTEGYGEYATILAYLLIFAILADFGLYTLMVREISRPDADESFIASNIFTLRLIIVLLTLGSALLIAYLFLPYPPTVKIGILLGSVFTVSSSLSQIVGGIYQKYLSFYVVSISDALTRLIQLLLVVLAWWQNAGLLAYVAAMASASALHFLFVFVYAQRTLTVNLRINWAYWKKILKNAFPIAVSLVFTAIYFRIDTLMLSLLKPQSDVGIYGLAAKFLEVTVFLPALYMGLIMPLLSKEAVADLKKFRELFQRSMELLILTAIFAFLFIALFAQQIISVLGGKEFSLSAQPLSILAMAIALIFLGNLGGQSAVALNLQRRAMWIYLGGAVLNTMLNLLFIPRFSYNGAAFTTVITEIFVTMLLFNLISHKLSTSIDWTKIKKALLAGILTSGIIGLLIPRSIYLAVGLSPLCYVIFLWLSGALNRAEIRSLFQEGHFPLTYLEESPN